MFLDVLIFIYNFLKILSRIKCIYMHNTHQIKDENFSFEQYES